MSWPQIIFSPFNQSECVCSYVRVCVRFYVSVSDIEKRATLRQKENEKKENILKLSSWKQLMSPFLNISSWLRADDALHR